ncbi:MAG TPA: hypothetical protein VNX28_05285 [Gemmataceae bacterium]|jgi:hypothetical protein|nr:hypothetical protein [Gemmataceae bacterium]
MSDTKGTRGNKATRSTLGTSTTGPDWEHRFSELVATWKRERGPHSSSARLAEHPAYQEIIRMGPEVVPLLLRELEREPDHWFRALHVLTGANPIPGESSGNVLKMAAAWLDWGRDQGYHW